MAENSKLNTGANLRKARLAAGLTKAALAKAAGMTRLQVLRAETGQYPPSLDEAVRLARVMRIPLERLTSGRFRPAQDLRGIAIELYHLGICDLDVSEPRVPGAFRRGAHVLAIALRGDRPDPRVIEALPFVLARQTFRVPLVVAFADIYDKRIRARLAWLSDVTLALSREKGFPIGIESEEQLDKFKRVAKKLKRPDGLGHPGRGKFPPIWLRWNITYAGTLKDFSARVHEVADAYHAARTPTDANEND